VRTSTAGRARCRRHRAEQDRLARRARSATRTHLLHLYGSLVTEVLAPAVDDPSLLEPIVAGRPDLRAQALYAREREWARTDEDVYRAAPPSGSRVPN